MWSLTKRLDRAPSRGPLPARPRLGQRFSDPPSTVRAVYRTVLCAEELPRRRHVGVDLGDQVGDVVEALLVAQAVAEVQRGLAGRRGRPRSRAGTPRRAAAAPERRVHADAGRAWAGRCRRAGGMPRVDAPGGDRQSRRRPRGWRWGSPASRRAGRRARRPRPRRCGRPSSSAARSTLPASSSARIAVDEITSPSTSSSVTPSAGETPGGPEVGQRGDVARGPWPNRKLAPTTTWRACSGSTSTRSTNSSALQVAQIVVERQRHDELDALLRQGRGLRASVMQQRRLRPGVHDLHRVAVERHHDAAQPALLRDPGRTRDDRPVAPVDPVEEPDRRPRCRPARPRRARARTVHSSPERRRVDEHDHRSGHRARPSRTIASSSPAPSRTATGPAVTCRPAVRRRGPAAGRQRLRPSRWGSRRRRPRA